METPIEWSDDLLFHIDEIDDQHRNLFLLINRLIGHKRNHGPREELIDLLRVLVAFAQTHFRTEENHMTESHYPHALEHYEEHEEFTKCIHNFMGDYERGKEDLSDKMLTFLRHWWNTHVAKSDQTLARYLKEKGHPS
ncbi:bacteriohemerythrin [Desulfoluna sp.]|uniref:bacteriohemerythrin n=1 Tax=Desulfoluna sp. TaxID=2045199 RepID=UPI00261AF831|nr:bacteriohemerythrin [Desulfoluna sp.]